MVSIFICDSLDNYAHVTSVSIFLLANNGSLEPYVCKTIYVHLVQYSASVEINIKRNKITNIKIKIKNCEKP